MSHNVGFPSLQGMMTPNYVVEIEILPWNCNSKLALSSGTPIHPLFQCEDGNYYIRQNGRLIQVRTHFMEVCITLTSISVLLF